MYIMLYAGCSSYSTYTTTMPLYKNGDAVPSNPAFFMSMSIHPVSSFPSFENSNAKHTPNPRPLGGNNVTGM